MWKLTIYQKKYSSYVNNGEEKTFDTEFSVEFTSPSIGPLFDIVASMSKVCEPTETRYELVKVVD